MRILVVDDSPAMRKIMRNALEGMGYSPASVLEATDGTEAIRILREPRFRIDIVLADRNMPNMDGLALLKQLQASERLKTIPFVMVTGERERDRVAEAVRAGARDYIVTPFTPEALREKVLAIEKELSARTKPTDTAIIRFEAAKAPRKPDADLPFLTQLPEHLVTELYRCASRTEHARGEVLVAPGDVVESLHVVDGGEIEILALSDGRRSLQREVRGRGECFGELSFLSGDPASAGVRARTKVSVSSVGKGEFEGLLAGYPALSFHLTRVLARRARKADAQLTSELERGLSGRLSTITLAEVVQTLHNSQKTGLLRVYREQSPSPSRPTGPPGPVTGESRDRSDEGEVYFADGNVRHARIGDHGGEEAFRKLVAWEEGSFVFEAGNHQVEHDVFRGTMGLLMEGIVRQEELCCSRSGSRATPAGEEDAGPSLSGWLGESAGASGPE